MRERLYHGTRFAGTLISDGKGVWLEYADSWLEDGFALSANLPLTERPVKMDAATFLGNLFPEERRRDIIRRLGKISPDSVLPFLRLYGDDLPGAISIRPEDPEGGERDITQEVARIIRRKLPLDLLGGRILLAGADPKAGVIAREIDGEWHFFAKTGTSLSTHILKATETLAEAEAMGMEVARLTGLDTCMSHLVNVGGEPAYLVERYDRSFVSGKWQRIQQEDFCQRLGFPETRKYLTSKNGMVTEKANRMLAGVVLGLSESERTKFIRASIFNIVFGNTDDHAKNYSLLLTDGAWTLAPLYDIISSRMLKKTFREWKALSPQMARPFGRSLLPAKISHRDFCFHASIFRMVPEELVMEWIDVSEKVIHVLDGFAGHFLAHRVPDGLSTQKMRDIERLAETTEKEGTKFAEAMLEIGLRASEAIHARHDEGGAPESSFS